MQIGTNWVFNYGINIKITYVFPNPIISKKKICTVM